MGYHGFFILFLGLEILLKIKFSMFIIIYGLPGNNSIQDYVFGQIEIRWEGIQPKNAKMNHIHNNIPRKLRECKGVNNPLNHLLYILVLYLNPTNMFFI